MKNGQTSHSLSEERDHYLATHLSLVPVFQAKNFVYFHHKKRDSIVF